MKVTDGHAAILRRVQDMTAQEGSLGGAMPHEIQGLDRDMTRTLNAMVNRGLLESFRTSRTVRGRPGSQYSCPDGFVLYRIGPAGAAYLLDAAAKLESHSFERRIALRMVGVPVVSIRAANPESCMSLRKVAEAIIDITEGMG